MCTTTTQTEPAPSTTCRLCAPWLVSVSLGRSHEDTALALVRNTGVLYRVPLLERSTNNAVIVDMVRRLARDTRLTAAPLLLDITGTGAEALSLFAPLPPHVVIASANPDHACDWRFTAQQLVQTMDALLADRRFQIAKQLPQARRFALELESFAFPNGTPPLWRRPGIDDASLFAVATALAFAESSQA